MSRKIGFHAPEPTAWEEVVRRELDRGQWPSPLQSGLILALLAQFWNTAQPALTLSACSFCTFLLASMSHLFPSKRRSTPAEAFWEQRVEAGSCSFSQSPSSSRFYPVPPPLWNCPHLFDALHPVLNILEGFLICDVIY